MRAGRREEIGEEGMEKGEGSREKRKEDGEWRAEDRLRGDVGKGAVSNEARRERDRETEKMGRPRVYDRSA